MTQDEQTRMKLVARYIKEAAAYGVKATGGNAESLEFFDYALSYLRRTQETWIHNGVRMWSPEHCKMRIDALTLCIEDTVRGQQIFTNDALLRLLASPTKEGHALDRL